MDTIFYVHFKDEKTEALRSTLPVVTELVNGNARLEPR